MNQQRSKLKKDMTDYIDIKEVDIREVKENIEALKQLYVDEADLFAKVQVLEPKVLVQKRCRYNNETFGTHELTLSELFEFVNGSAVFDDILSIVGRIEFGLSDNHVSASHLFIWESMAMGSRLLFGLQIKLNDGSDPPVVVSVPLDAQVSDMSRLRKKLVNEVDACIAVKCWQKINPDYPVNIELDLVFKSPIASKLKLEACWERSFREILHFQRWCR